MNLWTLLALIFAVMAISMHVSGETWIGVSYPWLGTKIYREDHPKGFRIALLVKAALSFVFASIAVYLHLSAGAPFFW